MAVTLTEAEKLSNDELLSGVILETIKDSPVLQKLPFIEISGNGLTFNRENAVALIGTYDVGDPWTESTPTFTQITAVLKIYGGDADVDNYLKATRSNIQDLEQEIINLKTKALRYKFETDFIYGLSSTYPTQFDGVQILIDTTTSTSPSSRQLVQMGTAAGASLTLTKLDELVDKVLGGKPDALMMSKRSRRNIQKLLRAAGAAELEPKHSELGTFIHSWNGIEFWENDNQLNTHVTTGASTAQYESANTGGDETTIYALSVGTGALMGLTSPGMIQVEPIGSLEGFDATRTRIKWYCSLALFATIKAAALIGVKD